MDAIIANLKSQLGEIIKEEVMNTMSRLLGKICKAMDVEEPEVDLQKFTENTLKKIMEESSEIFSKTEEDMQKLTIKAPKLKKDPNAPKPAVNSYIMYSRDNRSDVKEENPQMKAIDITKKLAEMWRSADEELKQEYKEKSEKDKKRYEVELETYEPKEGFQNPKEKKSKTSKKKKSGPSKPLNAYMWFCKDKRDDLKGKFNNTEILSELGRLWKNLSEKKKKPYNDKAEQDKERYEEEMKNYVPADGEEIPKKGKGKKSVKNDGPKRPMSAYLLFCKDKRAILKEEEPEMKQPEIMKKLGEMWKSVSEKEKKKYTDQSAKLIAEFKSANKEKNDEEEVQVEVEEEEVENDNEEDEVVLPVTGTPKKCMPKIVSDAKFAEMKEAEKQKQMNEAKRLKEKKTKKDDSDSEIESDEDDEHSSSKKVKKVKKNEKNEKKSKKVKKTQKKSKTIESDDEALFSDDE